jgi:hypothetical protein
MRAIIKVSPVVLAGAMFWACGSANAGPQSLLDPYYSVEPEKNVKAAKQTSKPSSVRQSKIDLSKLQYSQDGIKKHQAAMSHAYAGQSDKSNNNKVAAKPESKVASKSPSRALSRTPQPKLGAAEPGIVSGVRQIAGGVLATGKGAGLDVIHGTRYVTRHLMPATNMAAHSVKVASLKVKDGVVVVSEKIGDGAHIATSKLKDGTLACGHKMKDGAQVCGPKIAALPKAFGHGVKLVAVKLKDGSCATGRKIAYVSRATKDKVFDLMHPVGEQPVATAQLNAHGVQ